MADAKWWRDGQHDALFNVADRRQVVADIAAIRTDDELAAVAEAGRAALGDAERQHSG